MQFFVLKLWFRDEKMNDNYQVNFILLNPPWWLLLELWFAGPREREVSGQKEATKEGRTSCSRHHGRVYRFFFENLRHGQEVGYTKGIYAGAPDESLSELPNHCGVRELGGGPVGRQGGGGGGDEAVLVEVGLIDQIQAVSFLFQF